MDISLKPIAATTTLSIVFHGVAVAAVLLLQSELVPSIEGVGKGFDIHLVSSDEVADDLEAESIIREQAAVPVVEQREERDRIVQATENGRHTILPAEITQKNTIDKPPAIEVVESDVSKVEMRLDLATNASKQQHSIIELLHSRISDKKAYPYLARRQRREGVATVAFVLHPNGRIENAHLVSSSQTQSLDRAALSAVKDIEPFSVAQDYLKQSETFQVNVAFSLL